MSTIGEFRIPVGEFALERTIARIPDAEFDIGRAVPMDPSQVMIVLWAHGPDYDELRTALGDDPVVADLQGLVDLDIEWLYRMHWTDGLHLLGPAIAEHNATLIHAYGNREGWHLRVLVPERGAIAALDEWCERYLPAGALRTPPPGLE